MNSKITYSCLKHFLLISGSLLGSSLVLLNLLSTVSYGQSTNQKRNERVSYAKVDSVNGIAKYAPRGIHGIANANNASLKPVKGGENLKIPSNNLIIPRGQPGNIARMMFLLNNKKTPLPNTLYVARSSKKFDTTFYYYCRAAGNVEIGWKGLGKAASACDAFAIGKKKESTNKQLSQKAKRQAVTFCSAAAESGAWGAVISDNYWDLMTTNDPCREAIRRCEINSNSDNLPCNVTNLGEQYPKELGEQLTSVLVCNKDEPLLNNPPRQRDIFSELDGWVKQQASVDSPLHSSNCTLHVINANELLVIPDPKQTTVISAGDDILPTDESVIVALAGKVNLVSPDPNVPIETISAGQACYPDGIFSSLPPDFSSTDSTSTDSAPSLQSPTGTLQQRPSFISPICGATSRNEVDKNLPSDARQEIYKSLAVQSFLEGWLTPEVQKDVDDNYKPEIKRQFLNIANSTPTPIR
jgi:hypothetical protein